ncbi:MAG: rubredoxin [Oscillospiraceae bacterium]
MERYVCSVCGYVYDEGQGAPDAQLAPGTRWADVPKGWPCPVCGAAKDRFAPQGGGKAEKAPPAAAAQQGADAHPLRQLSAGELSAICSNLARGSEKQYLDEEAGLFRQLADYYKGQTALPQKAGREHLADALEADLNAHYPRATAAATEAADRGALRALVWSEKVTRILQSLLGRVQREGTDFIRDTSVYVCDICGFVFVGAQPPGICPICKVPSLKIVQLQRRDA